MKTGKQQDHFADVIIIGFGAAGMMAGINIAEQGLKVIILEKGPSIISCNAAKAAGPALAETMCQKNEGASVSIESLYQHMFQFSRGTVNPGLLRNTISQGKRVEQFFSENGIQHYLLPDAYGIGFQARQVILAKPMQRMEPFKIRIEKSGGRVLTNMNAIKLILDECGSVSGVEAKNTKTDEVSEYHGKAVLVASGGYLGNPKMMKEKLGNIMVNPLGNCYSDGTGIQMILEAGGTEDRNWGLCCNEFGGANQKCKGKIHSLNMQYAIAGGLLVDKHGKRFMNEQYLTDQPLSLGGDMTMRVGKFYAVLDEKMYQSLHKMSVYEYYDKPQQWHAGKMVHNKMNELTVDTIEKDIEAGWAAKGNKLDEVADGFNLQELVRTVEHYNKLCDKCSGDQNEEDFGKAGYLMKPIEKPPFYVFEYEQSAWCTFGGVKTDEKCRVLDKNGDTISGLYAAGVDNGSCYTAPYYDNEGAALGIAFGTGLVASDNIIQELIK